MIDFLIKSTISLGVLYLFYKLLLSRIKTLEFNRYFLVGSVVFSVVIPFISIPIYNTVVPLQDALEVLLISDSIEQTGVVVNVAQEESLITTNILLFLYLTISSILLIRFCINLSNIIRQIRKKHKVKQAGFTLILVKEKVLPHTFFKYILVNDGDYRNGRIDDAMIQHEVAHCNQWHSLDIVFIELLKIILWINPFIWLIKKSVQLNHEYLADDSVLASHHLGKYQDTLINTVLANNEGVLVSNFNFSFTKQRIKMMTKQFCKTTGITGIISAFLLILILGFTISCKQKSTDSQIAINDDKANVHEADKWLQSFHIDHDFNQIRYNSFPDIFEMGSTNSLKSRMVILENAFIFLTLNDNYSIPKSPIHRDIDIEYIYAKNAFVEFYESKDSDKASEEVSAPLSREFIHYQNEERKRLDADTTEKHLNMNAEN